MRLIWFVKFVAFEMIWYMIIHIVALFFIVPNSLVLAALAISAAFLVTCALCMIYVVMAVAMFLTRHPNTQLPDGDVSQFRTFLTQEVKLLF